MASHNGFSNGVNGTTEVKVVERSMTTTQVKSIQSVSFSSQSVHIQGMVSQPSGLQPAIHQPGFISNEAIGTSPQQVQPQVVRPASHRPGFVTTLPINPQTVNLQPSLPISNPPVVTSPQASSPISIKPIATSPQPATPISIQPIVTSPQPSNPISIQPATPISIQPIVQPQIITEGADSSSRPSAVTIQPASHRPGFVTTLPINPQPVNPQPSLPISIQPVVTSPQASSPISIKPIATSPQPATPISIQPATPISIQPIQPIVQPQIMTEGADSSSRPSAVTIQPASHRPGFVTTLPINPQPVNPQPSLPISIQPVVTSPQASSPISIKPIATSPQPATPISIQPIQPIVQPQIITEGANSSNRPSAVTIQPASHRPGFVTTLPINPQPVNPQPSTPISIQPIVTSPQQSTPISIQPIVQPQIITEGANSSNRPSAVTIQPINTRPAVPISIQPVVTADPQPQVIVEGPQVTREVKDASESSLQVIGQPSTKLPEPVSMPVPNLPQVIEIPAPKLPGNMPGSTDFQVPSYAVTALNQIVQAEGFTNYVIKYDRGSNFGDGFVAEIVRARINGSQMIKGVQQDSELVLVVKLPPENKARRELMGMNVFEREVIAYNEIIPMFQKFQLDKGLKPGQGFVSFPKCYYASFNKEKDEAIIIMEDIRKRGFKMLNKYRPVDFPHARFVLETIAQLHGLSLAMKDQCPGVFERFKGLQDMMANDMMDNEMMKSVTTLNCQKAIDALEPHEENMKQKLRSFGENIVDIVKACANGELSEPYSVINHGDCWINNMMFKYQSGFPRHLCLLDWQIVRYASPVLDICYFLYLCTDSALRAQHFDTLIQGYHIALRKQVELLGSDVNQILPFTALLREMKSKAKFALSTALFIIPMLCTPNSELPNMDDVVESFAKGQIDKNNQIIHMTSNTESIYKIRMGGIIRDMNRKGYL